MQAPWKNVSAAAVLSISVEGEILLVKRSNRPLVGIWTAPMGHIEEGETAEETAAREHFEETGLVVDIEKQIHRFENAAEGVTLDLFLGKVKNTELLQPGDDAEDAQLFSRNTVPYAYHAELVFPESEKWALEIHLQIMEQIRVHLHQIIP